MDIVYEDIGFEDLTTQALIPPDFHIKGKIIAKEDGIVAGIDLASAIFNEFSIKSFHKKSDGERVSAGETVMEIDGQARSILMVERTVLNFLMRLSGIATVTQKMLKMIRKVNPEITLAGTRKTTPGLQFLEKQAIRVGGGDTHRYRLDSCVLIKDNHLVLVGNVEEAVKRARSYASFTTKIEVEADTKKQALEAVNAGADILMLDNMDIDQVVDVLSSLKSLNLRSNVIVEVSGGITFDNIVDYAKTGVDVISTGYITHSVTSLNMSLEINEQ
jgi:nicotinate-nucleotide pyrophosphorylase (carboxylating)